jgi:hypothetical protein
MHAPTSRMSFLTLTHESDNDTGQDGHSKQRPVATLVTAVVRGAARFLGDEHARRTWDDRIAHLGLDLTKNPLQVFREKALRSAGCNIEAELLLGSLLLLFQCERGTTVHHSDTQYRRFARFIFTLLNILYIYVGDDAFKIIPALSGESYEDGTSQVELSIDKSAQPSDGKIVRAATAKSWKGETYKQLGEDVAFALLLHSDQRWRVISAKFAFDPVTRLTQCVTRQAKT